MAYIIPTDFDFEKWYAGRLKLEEDVESSILKGLLAVQRIITYTLLATVRNSALLIFLLFGLFVMAHSAPQADPSYALSIIEILAPVIIIVVAIASFIFAVMFMMQDKDAYSTVNLSAFPWITADSSSFKNNNYEDDLPSHYQVVEDDVIGNQVTARRDGIA
jgi:hypothetical protein